MTLTELKTALASTGYEFAHHGWSRHPDGDFGVWAEEKEHTIWAGNHRAEHNLSGYIDYYTRDDSDTPRTTIEAALDGIEISWYLNAIIYEENTGYIHYEWIWEAV